MSDPGSLPDRQDLLAAEIAEHYLIEEELGRGGSATVYLAQDLRHGRRVALKVLHSALGAALGVERFQREIRTQARLHPRAAPHEPELDQPGRASERPDLGAASRSSAVRPPGRVRLTVHVSVSYIGLMRPETRRNRNPLSIDHAFT